MRAGNLDIVVETGTLMSRDVQVHVPGPPVEAQTVTVGQRLFVDRVPQLVHAADTAAGWTTFRFGRGLYSDPRLTVTATALVVPAVPTVVVDAIAAYSMETIDLDGIPVVETVPITTTIAGDGLTVTLTVTADESEVWHDRAGAHSWDLYVQTAVWDWQRVLEGTLTVLAGDSR